VPRNWHRSTCMRVVLEVPVRFQVSSYFKFLTEDEVTDGGRVYP